MLKLLHVTSGLPHRTNPCINVFNNIGNEKMVLFRDTVCQGMRWFWWRVHNVSLSNLLHGCSKVFVYDRSLRHERVKLKVSVNRTKDLYNKNIQEKYVSKRKIQKVFSPLELKNNLLTQGANNINFLKVIRKIWRKLYYFAGHYYSFEGNDFIPFYIWYFAFIYTSKTQGFLFLYTHQKLEVFLFFFYALPPFPQIRLLGNGIIDNNIFTNGLLCSFIQFIFLVWLKKTSTFFSIEVLCELKNVFV